MGTVVSIHVDPGPCRRELVHDAIAKACAQLHDHDSTFTTYDEKSPMSRIRRGALGLSDAPSEIRDVLELCAQAKELTKGWFDPWAIPGGVDPTGLVKGWAIEQAAAVFAQVGVSAAVVNGGGDVALVGSAPGGGTWRVGVQHPWRPGALACVVEVRGNAVATSGCYQREQHVVAPREPGRSREVASASVTGESLAMADAFATAIVAGGGLAAEAIAAVPGYEAYWIGSDGTEHWTSGVVFG